MGDSQRFCKEMMNFLSWWISSLTHATFSSLLLLMDALNVLHLQ